MRQKIVAGNWKMNLTYAEAMALSDAVADGLKDGQQAEIVLAPPFVYLHDVLRRVGHRDRISIAAQDCSQHDSGAYTGEISAAMLNTVGAEFVLIGHSERRQYFGESNQLLAGKVRQALRNSLIPIFCCGESLKEREAGMERSVVTTQLLDGLLHLKQEELSGCVIAYEPVWAIGTGKTASPAQVQEMHAAIRDIVRSAAPDIADKMSVLYGGSVNAANARDLFREADVDGALVGGASLKGAEFLKIIDACN